MKSKKLLEAELFQAEELIRVISKAIDLIPVREIASGAQWLPSEEAMLILMYAKERLGEWKATQ